MIYHPQHCLVKFLCIKIHISKESPLILWDLPTFSSEMKSISIFFHYLSFFKYIWSSSRQHVSRNFWDSEMMQIESAFHQVQAPMDARESHCPHAAKCCCGTECFLSSVEAYLSGCQFAFLPSPLTKHWTSSSGRLTHDPRRIKFYCQEPIYLPGENRERPARDGRGRQTTGAEPSPWYCPVTHLCLSKVRVREGLVSSSSWQLFYPLCLLFRIYHLVS